MEPQKPLDQPAAPPDPLQTPQTKRRLPWLWVIAAIAGLILIAGGIFWYMHQGTATKQASNSESSAPDSPADYDNSDFKVEVTTTAKDGVFTPATLTIAPHTRVNWQNDDTSSHWLARNDPSQKDGPAASSDNDPRLPTRTEIAAGGGYAHVFEKAGTYVFHLIDKPTTNITIIVK